MNTPNNSKNNGDLFDSDDTQGSDLSYESSFQVEDEFDNRPKNIESFKQEMNRFLLNNPDLKNPTLVCKEDFAEDKNMWTTIANQIFFDQRKGNSTPSIESFAKRLNLYRNKIEKQQMIDIILREHPRLLKKIENQLEKQRKTQKSVHNTIQAKLKKQTGDVTYYSWRKNKQLQFRIDKAQEKALSSKKNKSRNHKEELSNLQREALKQSSFSLPNMEPKTEAGKALLEQLKKCTDKLTAKKTIINFVLRHRQTVNKDFECKPSLLQQSQKFYNEQSKEFVLLYPNPQIKMKLNSGQYTRQKLQAGQKQSKNTESYKMLNKIINSNLMTYWKNIQIKNA